MNTRISHLIILCGGFFIGLTMSACAEESGHWPAGAEVYFIAPEDGATVSSPVRVVFGLRGLGIAPAGVDESGTGHHHLLIDTEVPSGEDLQYALPSDEQHVHFGRGQTEALLDLAPGEHTLQMILGDWSHVPHDPPLVSRKIIIHVE